METSYPTSRVSRHDEMKMNAYLCGADLLAMPSRKTVTWSTSISAPNTYCYNNTKNQTKSFLMISCPLFFQMYGLCALLHTYITSGGDLLLGIFIPASRVTRQESVYMGTFSSQLAEILAVLPGYRQAKLHVCLISTLNQISILAGKLALPSNSVSRVTRLHINRA